MGARAVQEEYRVGNGETKVETNDDGYKDLGG